MRNPLILQTPAGPVIIAHVDDREAMAMQRAVSKNSISTLEALDIESEVVVDAKSCRINPKTGRNYEIVRDRYTMTLRIVVDSGELRTR